MDEMTGSGDNLDQQPTIIFPGAEEGATEATAGESDEDQASSDKLENVVKQSSKLTHDLSQPLTFILTSLELGVMSGGIDGEECSLLLEAVTQMRDAINSFRQGIREIEKKS